MDHTIGIGDWEFWRLLIGTGIVAVVQITLGFLTISLFGVGLAWFRRVVCRHPWELLHDKEFKPPITTVTEAGYKVNETPDWYFREMYVAVVKCPKCGALETITKEFKPQR